MGGERERLPCLPSSVLQAVKRGQGTSPGPQGWGEHSSWTEGTETTAEIQILN